MGFGLGFGLGLGFGFGLGFGLGLGLGLGLAFFLPALCCALASSEPAFFECGASASASDAASRAGSNSRCDRWSAARRMRHVDLSAAYRPSPAAWSAASSLVHNRIAQSARARWVG